MGRPENPLIAILDDANSGQEEARTAARRLAARLEMSDPNVRDLEIIIRATLRIRRCNQELRELIHSLRV